MAGTAAVVSVVTVLSGCTTSSAQPHVGKARDAPTPTAAAPAVAKDCWVPTSAGNVSLSGEDARALTTRAAELGRHSRNPARIAAQLQPAVERVLRPEPDPPMGAADSTTPAGSAATGPTDPTGQVLPSVVREVAAGLTGVRPQSRLVCSYARSVVEPQKPGPSGLVPRARRLRAAWTDVFGPLTAGGFARGGVTSGHVDGSAHYEGRAIDVFFRPVGDREQHRRGWVFAQWLVAHAPDHQLLSVIYDDHIWTSWAAYAGWRDYVHPGASFAHRGNAILRHREHVHVAVESGRPYRGR